MYSVRTGLIHPGINCIFSHSETSPDWIARCWINFANSPPRFRAGGEGVASFGSFLRKLQWSIGFDVVERYRCLQKFAEQVHIEDEARWLA